MSWSGGDVRLSEPAAPGDFPDPFVLWTGRGYVALATASGGRNIHVRSSDDLRTWAELPDGLPRLPQWSRPGRTWSPAVLRAGGRWVLWYATVEPLTGRQALSVGVAEAPTGPFEDMSTSPAVFQAELGGSIDPSTFGDRHGGHYLVWKADSNAIGRPSTIWGQRLSPDGTALTGEPGKLLAHDRAWERPLVEAPCLVQADDGYLMLYSAGKWNSPGYSIGVAAAPHPLGPWAKLTTERPWACSDHVAQGPGGQESFLAADGALLLAYHAWQPGRARYRDGGTRTLRLGRLELGSDRVGLSPLE